MISVMNDDQHCECLGVNVGRLLHKNGAPRRLQLWLVVEDIRARTRYHVPLPANDERRTEIPTLHA